MNRPFPEKPLHAIAAMMCAATTIVLWCSRTAHAQSVVQAGDVPAAVGTDFIRFVFRPPYHRVRPPSPATPGYFAWRIVADSAAHLAFAFGPDQVMTEHSASALTKASSLRRCPAATVRESVIPLDRCVTRIDGTVTVQPDAVVVVVRDSAVVAEFRRARPLAYSRYVFEPGGRYRIDRRPFEYLDPKRQ